MLEQFDDGSAICLIRRLKGGDHSVAPLELWDRFHCRLEMVARKVLRGSSQTVENCEDVALDSVAAFLEGVYRGRFPALHDQNDLWTVLLTITVRRATNARRRAAVRLGAPHVELDSWSPVSDCRPSPDLMIEASDTCDYLLAALNDESLRLVARLKLCEYSSSEIADHTGLCQRSVERKLSLIRQTWRRKLQSLR